MNIEKLKIKLDQDKFWLLVRKFAMAKEGIDRAHAKQAILNHVAQLLSDMESEG